ncbi:hypothetical protein P3T21_007511 [Paraburkholderia sp. GAS334]
METIPSALSSILMMLLAKTPEERYQTAGGVKRDLERKMQGRRRGKTSAM